MAVGPGKYDDLATYVREQAKALGVIVIVVEGSRGNGFSAQLPAHLQARLARMLRDVADQIDPARN